MQTLISTPFSNVSMVSTVLTTVILLTSSIVLGSGVVLYGTAIFPSENLYQTIETYDETANTCDLGDRDKEIKNKIFTAKKEFELNNNSVKAKEILNDVKPVLLECELKYEPVYFGISFDSALTTIGAIVFIVGSLVASGIAILKYVKGSPKD
ncbi:hypothetical protein [Nitrosopumilus sp.]|uniref:hypothetical protein n=1 Tax=Nitrosopumilus sp. TaxID=2024843 RepID=UPI0026057F80|nr:hypothetical protein [Nitrosopumilus sp.]